MFIPNVEAYLFHIILSNYQVTILVGYNWYKICIPVLWLPKSIDPHSLQILEQRQMVDIHNNIDFD